MIDSVARRAARGAAWNIGTGVTVRAMGLAGTLVLTRFVAPADYGEVSVALICVLTSARLVTLGFGPFVIARRTDPGDTFQMHVLHTTAIVLACLGVVLAREPLGALLGSPGMVRFLPGLALATVITQVSHIPSATLVRSLSFRVVALSRGVGEVAFTAVAVALAPLLGPAAIVAGNLARAVLTSVLLVLRSNKSEWWHPVALRWETIRGALVFGLPLTASSLGNTLATQADNLLVARLFGPKVMGQYNLAYNLATTPTNNVAEHIGDVLLPSFAKMGADQRRRALPRAAGLMALVLLPLAAGLAAVSRTLVPIALDSRWAGLAPMLEILCILALPYPVVWLVTSLLEAEGRTKAIMCLSILKVTLVFGLVLSVGRAGPLWACGSVALAFILYGVAYLLVGRGLAGVPATPLLLATVRPLVASGLMVAVVLVVRQVAAGAGFEPGVARLVLEVASGVAVYAGAAFLLAGPALAELLGLVRVTLVGWSRR